MLGVSSQSIKALISQIYKINNINDKEILKIMIQKIPTAGGGNGDRWCMRGVEA